MWSVKVLAERVNAQVLGDAEVQVSGIQTPEQAGTQDLVFLFDARRLPSVLQSGAGAFVLNPKHLSLEVQSRPILLVEHPRKALAQLLKLFYPRAALKHFVSPQAVLGSGVQLSEPLSIGPFVVIGNETNIGARTQIGSHVSIGSEVIIGSDVTLGPHVTIYDGVHIGDRVVIHAGTVIGSDGYGFFQEGGEHHKIPQLGSVEIHDDVEIGANVTIDCGTLGNTVIGTGTKIDNLVQIGHNVIIGKHCLIIAQVGISGSAQLGDHVVLAGQTGVAGHLTLGSSVVAAGKSGITQDVASGTKISGFPAQAHLQTLRQQAALRRLPELIRWWQQRKKDSSGQDI